MSEALREFAPGALHLREIDTRQVEGESPRRWFTSARCDLIVWLDGEGAPRGFQFCYDKDQSEHALTWMADHGYSHMRVDTGATSQAGASGTPLLVANGVFDAERILGLFRGECDLLPAEYVELVSGKLHALASVRR